MKKLLTLCLVGILAVSLCACNSTSSTEKEVDNSTTTIISEMSLQDAYTVAEKRYTEDPTNNRFIGELQPETQEIIEMNGQLYQSYVASNIDIRYMWLSNAEMPKSYEDALWDWVSVGTSSNYSLDLLGTMDEGRK